MIFPSGLNRALPRASLRLPLAFPKIKRPKRRRAGAVGFAAVAQILRSRPAGMVAGVLSLGVNFLAPARNLTSVLQLKHRRAFSVPERTDYFLDAVRSGQGSQAKLTPAVFPARIAALHVKKTPRERD